MRTLSLQQRVKTVKLGIDVIHPPFENGGLLTPT